MQTWLQRVYIVVAGYGLFGLYLTSTCHNHPWRFSYGNKSSGPGSCVIYQYEVETAGGISPEILWPDPRTPSSRSYTEHKGVVHSLLAERRFNRFNASGSVQGYHSPELALCSLR